MKRRPKFLFRGSYMSQSEQDTIVNYYLSHYAPAHVKRGATLYDILKRYPYSVDASWRLIDKGLIKLVDLVRPGDRGALRMTPQGEDAAKTILGLERLKKRVKELGIKGNLGGWFKVGNRRVQGWSMLLAWAIGRTKRANYSKHLLDIAEGRCAKKPILCREYMDHVAAGLLTPVKPRWVSELEFNDIMSSYFMKR